MLQNTAAFTAQDINAIFGTHAFVPDYFASVGVSTDTRTMQPGSIFVALKGERFDAHNNIGEAMIKGAACVIMEERWIEEWNAHLGREYPSFARVVVPSSLQALAQLALHHRKRCRIPVVAIAGAAGKTSTKDLTAHVLSSRLNVLKTSANYNNQVGTPLTLLGITKRHHAAVIEIGTNEPGEIELLAAMTHPTHGIITNIGKEHLEKLIDLDGVEREETALFRELEQRGGVPLVNMDDVRLAAYSSLPDAIRFTTQPDVHPDAEIRIHVGFTDELHPHLTIATPGWNGDVTMQTVGYASALNAACAVAAAYSLGMEGDDVCNALTSYQPHVAESGYARMTLEEMGGIHILNDCYNANPESMVLALRTLAAYPAAGNRIALLGDMRELGDAAAAEHRTVLEAALTYADTVYVIGDEFRRAAEGNSRVVQLNTTAEANALPGISIRAGDCVLVKASRGLAFERILAAWREMQ
ncbi:MAG: UDP-N-acetylmuramoyl-tripeptide--D-alanyl-D-alanine ligase [Candidatus Kapabacteria bacterium]|nr:UDP-N-acetylmuramoyl-tripeptide--D-alanyl-D-alanine ligase [Candidatus Kapabacteria bacterium]